MRLIAKTRSILIANKAESMIEVVVAFLVLSIVLALFAQGIRFATTAEVYAIEKTKDSDTAMQALQDAVSGHMSSVADVGSRKITDNGKLSFKNESEERLKLKLYTVELNESGDSNKYYYYVFDANLE